MKRYLPPLLLLAVFGTLVVRCAMDPYREQAQKQITGHLLGGERARATRELERYVERYTGIEDRWFASRVWFRLQRPDRGISTIWDDPALRAQEGTARRFALSALSALGWEDEARVDPTRMEPFALIILVEGHDAWAEERLREHAQTLELMGSTTYFFPAYRRATRHPMDLITSVYRARGDEKFEVAAALGALGPEDYPEKQADLENLKRVIADPSWRRQFRDVWAVACVALGRSGDKDARAALDRVAAGLEGSAALRDQEDLLLVRNGQLAAGDWSIEPDQAAEMLQDAPPQMALVWYLEALIHRYRLGDMRTELRLRKVWEGPGKRVPPLRDRIARAFLLQDDLPSDAAQETWVGRMLGDLERPDASLMAHVLAAAWRLRKGVKDAKADLIEALQIAGRAFQDRPEDAVSLARPFLEALRALYLYG